MLKELLSTMTQMVQMLTLETVERTLCEEPAREGLERGEVAYRCAANRLRRAETEAVLKMVEASKLDIQMEDFQLVYFQLVVNIEEVTVLPLQA